MFSLVIIKMLQVNHNSNLLSLIGASAIYCGYLQLWNSYQTKISPKLIFLKDFLEKF